MKAFSKSEVDRLIDATPDAATQTMFLLAFEHGMRPSEICGLLWADVNLADRTITVRRLKHSITTVQSLTDVARWLLESLPRSGRRVFNVDRTTYWRRFKDACKLAGLPAKGKGPHCLKHSLGVLLVRSNVPLPAVQAALGHRAISNTIIYTKLSDEEVDSARKGALA